MVFDFSIRLFFYVRSRDFFLMCSTFWATTIYGTFCFPHFVKSLNERFFAKGGNSKFLGELSGIFWKIRVVLWILGHRMHLAFWCGSVCFENLHFVRLFWEQGFTKLAKIVDVWKRWVVILFLNFRRFTAVQGVISWNTCRHQQIGQCLISEKELGRIPKTSSKFIQKGSCQMKWWKGCNRIESYESQPPVSELTPKWEVVLVWIGSHKEGKSIWVESQFITDFYQLENVFWYNQWCWGANVSYFFNKFSYQFDLL